MSKKLVSSQEYIDHICELYGDIYDDRIEDCKPPAAGEDIRNPGEDWIPGQKADHKSLNAFQKELMDMPAIRMETEMHARELLIFWSLARMSHGSQGN